MSGPKHSIMAPCLLLLGLLCPGSTDAIARTRVQNPSATQKGSVERPVISRVVFGKDGRYAAVLFCCWHISVYDQQGGKASLIWDWDKSEGEDGFKEDLVVQDVDGDGNEEVAFRSTKTTFCVTVSAAVVYAPVRRLAFLLRYDGEAGVHLSPGLKEDPKTREWLVSYWRQWYKDDPGKLTITYDAEQ